MLTLIQNIDNGFYQAISQIINPLLTTFFVIITNFASPLYFALLFLILLLFLKDKKSVFFIGVGGFTAFLVNRIIKNIAQRPRPNIYPLITETGFSLPSAHAMLSLVVFGFIIYLIKNSSLTAQNKKISSLGLITLIILIGFSRIYLGVHYLSDVIMGYTFGGIILYSLILLYQNKKVNKFIDKNKYYKKIISYIPTINQ